MCESQVEDDDKVLKCETCLVWFHTECEKLPDSVYEFLIKEEAGKQLH